MDLNNDGQTAIIGQFSHFDPSENGYERFYIARYKKIDGYGIFLTILVN
ncbi:hypothetical protein [Shimazuella kribbensis]|nr:hypothetical protein [Shimazuella kribbensis]